MDRAGGRQQEKSFSIENTNSVKGVALCLLLVCHLFIQRPDIGLTVKGIPIAQYLADLSKVCVALFVLMSGYGLNESLKGRRSGLRSFFVKRAAKIYLSYWFVWLLFVPPGIVVFGRTLESVYTRDVAIKFALNLLGLHKFFGFWGYNETWWYISLTIGLYLLFPVLRILVRRYGLFVVVINAPLVFIPFKYYATLGLLWVVLVYLFTFTLGIYASQVDLFVKMKSALPGHRGMKQLLITALLMLIIWQRMHGVLLPETLDSATVFNGVLAFWIVVFGYELVFPFRPLGRLLTFIGEHSYNIFLFHTFIYYYYFGDFIYAFKYPVVIFMVLLSLCLLVSGAIEKLKALVGIDRLTAWICHREYKDGITF